MTAPTDHHGSANIKKRIVVGCDGTWMDSDGQIQTPSNVTRILRAVPRVGKDAKTNTDIAQITYYQNGIGTDGSGWYSRNIGKYINGATGEGIASNIRAAYQFVCANYNDGDEIVLVGFSRGAFTARSIASLIGQVGLLTTEGLEDLVAIVDDWEHQCDDDWMSLCPDRPWKNKSRFDKEYALNLAKSGLSRPNITIKCVGVWDTVGALGIPLIALFPLPEQKQFSFVDTTVGPHIEYAFHALALDEKRRAYHPTVWAKPEGQKLPIVLKQTWFPGVHSDCGGSYDDHDLGYLSLAWMMGQMIENEILTFDTRYVLNLIRTSLNKQIEQQAAKPATSDTVPIPRKWGMGKIHDCMDTFIFRTGGEQDRTPGCYPAVWREHPDEKDRPVTGTNEKLHASLRVRMGTEGLGYNDHGTYVPRALKGWNVESVSPDNHAVATNTSPRMKWWKQHSFNSDIKTQTSDRIELEEDDMTPFEIQVLSSWDTTRVIPIVPAQPVVMASPPSVEYADNPEQDSDGAKPETQEPKLLYAPNPMSEPEQPEQPETPEQPEVEISICSVPVHPEAVLNQTARPFYVGDTILYK